MKNFSEDLVKQEIRRWGPLTFAQFMELALYHPQHGYYSRQEPQRGRRGDYFTSLQTSSVFPSVLAQLVRELRQQLDSSEFTLIEFGSGGGELLEGILTLLQQSKELKGLRVISVEQSLSARHLIQKRLSRFPRCEVVASLEEADTFGGLEGCVLSNEFFDALPFRRLRYHEAGWREIKIGLDGERLVELETPLQDLSLIPTGDMDPWQPGQEIEVCPTMDAWYRDLGLCFSRGTVVTFDYGYPRSQLYSPRRMKGTWLCYHKHQAIQDALVNIGRQDVTAHIDFTRLVEAGSAAGFQPNLFASQGLFLSHVGQKFLENYLATAPEQEKAKRMGVLQQLLHPDAMGEVFWVLLQTKQALLPPSLAPISNRIKRLLSSTPSL